MILPNATPQRRLTRGATARAADPVPIFRDEQGALCAMAYLIERSGRTDIVDRVSGTRNLAYIRELTDDTDLVSWLDSAGLTPDEAARIQPQYQCGTPIGCEPPRIEPTPPVGKGYAAASILTGGLSLTTTVRSLRSPSCGRGWQAVFAGGVEALVGLAYLDAHGPTANAAVANTMVGGLAIAAGIRAIRVAANRPPSPTSKGGGKTIELGLLPRFNLATQAPQRGVQLLVTF